MMWSSSRALVALLLVLGAAAHGAHAGSAAAQSAKATPEECIQKLSDAASRCSSCLNRANKVAYQRLDRLTVSRSNIRLDVGRFFHLAVGFSQDVVKAPEACCTAAAEVFSAKFQAECACLPEVVAHTKYFDKELFDYYFDFLSSSCPLEGAQQWQQCGLVGGMFITKVTDAAAQWAGDAAGAAAGIAGGMAGAAAGVAGGVAGAAAGVAGGVADAAARGPFAGRRKLRDGGAAPGQCSTRGLGSRVALNNATAPFYFLCPAGKGYCDSGACVFGRTPAVSKGEWASCQNLDNCGAQDAGGGSGCFPAAARARLEGGRSKRMDELAVGDRVLALSKSGDLEFQDVYFFGHRDSNVEAEFVRIEFEGGAALELTPDHFVPVAGSGSEGAVGERAAAAAAGARMTYARDVRAGDVLLLASDDVSGGLRAAAAAAVSRVRRRGLFNPYTLGGDIVVDGVLASAHSSWLVDDVFAAAGAPHLVPAALQAAFAPLRAVYRLAGPRAMEAVGDALASAGLRLDAALRQLGGGGGGGASAAAGPAAAAATAAAAAAATAVLKRRLAAAA